MAILAIIYMILAVIGGVRSYSPVPFWDMWDGCLNFYLKVQDGDLSAFLSKHNEHFIFLSRILFWIDNFFFKGTSVFLIVANFIFSGLISYGFYCNLRRAFPNKEQNKLSYSLSFFILALTFSWMQYENFTWAFQSQFFLAYLLPLFSFYYLYLFSENKARSRFLIALVIGIASAGTMANGIFTLPLMTLMSIFLKLEWKKIVLLGTLSSLSLYLFFHTLLLSNQHLSFSIALLQHPLEFLKYFFLFLANPFFYIVGDNKIILVGIGAVFTISFIRFICIYFKDSNPKKIQLIFFAIIFYIIITSITIAGGRLHEAAPFSSRYATPGIVAWLAWLILYIYNKPDARKNRIIPILIAILIILFPLQKTTLSSSINPFEKTIAGLAVKMQIRDQKQLSFIYPSFAVFDTAKKAIDTNCSFFGTSRFKDVGNAIGLIVVKPVTNYLGIIEKSSSIEEDAYVKIEGWIFDPSAQKVPSAVRFLDTDHKVIGYAFTGKKRRDIKKRFGSNALSAGFSGYILAEYANRDVLLEGI